MSLILQLTENRELRIEVDVEEWKGAFERALRNDEVVEIRDPDGPILAINPHQVLYWKTAAEEPASAEGSPQPVG